jgi:hypothetical protein
MNQAIPFKSKSYQNFHENRSGRFRGMLPVGRYVLLYVLNMCTYPRILNIHLFGQVTVTIERSLPCSGGSEGGHEDPKRGILVTKTGKV